MSPEELLAQAPDPTLGTYDLVRAYRTWIRNVDALRGVTRTGLCMHPEKWLSGRQKCARCRHAEEGEYAKKRRRERWLAAKVPCPHCGRPMAPTSQMCYRCKMWQDD